MYQNPKGPANPVPPDDPRLRVAARYFGAFDLGRWTEMDDLFAELHRLGFILRVRPEHKSPAPADREPIPPRLPIRAGAGPLFPALAGSGGRR